MCPDEIQPKPSQEMEDILARREMSFRHLRSNGIRKSLMDEFERFLSAPGNLSRPSLIIRCRISSPDHHFRIIIDKPVSHRRLKSFLQFLQRVVCLTSEPADFFVLFSDRLYVPEQAKAEFIEYLKHVPFLRSDQHDDDTISCYCILIPDFYLQDPKYAEELTAIQNASAEIAFEQRAPIVKWRGTLMGPDYPNIDNCWDFPRFKLLMLASKHLDILDARVTSYDNVSGSRAADMLRRQLEEMFGAPAEFVPFESFVGSRYLISVDGVASTWKRVPNILATGSVLLLQHQWKQFFHFGLKPWIHYVPVADDLSDLPRQYEWLARHQSNAKRIGENGQRFAQKILNPKLLENYFVDVVDQCGQLYLG